MARQPGSDRLMHSHSDSSMALSVAETATPGSSLRLASYNLHGWRDTDHADNLQRIIDTLQKINADVGALQEVLHPFRPPSEPAAAAARRARAKLEAKGFECFETRVGGHGCLWHD